MLSISDVEENDIVIESEMIERTQRSETVKIELCLTVHARSGGLFETKARRQIKYCDVPFHCHTTRASPLVPCLPSDE